ncbi:hypothetical protein V8C42DRAFT_314771 [Trichoderma barbatum]
MITRCGRGWLGLGQNGSVGSERDQDSGAGRLVSFGLDRPNQRRRYAEADSTHTLPHVSWPSKRR